MKHDKPFKISTYLNKRQASKTIKGHFACYIRVYPHDRSFPTFFVTTNESCSIEQYENMFVQSRNKLKPTNTRKFDAITKMVGKAQSLNDFKVCRSPQAFKDKWNGTRKYGTHNHGYTLNVKECFRTKISELEETHSYGTIDTYINAKKSLSNYFASIKKDFNKISFYDITKSVLINFHNWHLDKGNTPSSIGIHLRNLRHLFNLAIDNNLIDKESCYPFGKKKYVIPVGEGTNRALESDTLETFWFYEPSTVARKKSKELWFLSYFASGVNFKDLVYLKHTNVKKDTIEFIRAKSKSFAEKKIIINRNDFINMMLKKNRGLGKYAFNFVSHKLSDSERHRVYKNKLGNHNKLFKKIMKEMGIIDNLSYYWGRHSFATRSRDKGVKLALIGQMMGHTNLKTTEAYFNKCTYEDMENVQDTIGFGDEKWDTQRQRKLDYANKKPGRKL